MLPLSPDSTPGVPASIGPEPAYETRMRAAVLFVADGRGHVNDSFDQLGLLQARHRVVATLEFVAAQVVRR